MNDWIDSLTVPQVRALAHQAGYKWTMAVDKLIRLLKNSHKAKQIYEEHYGEKASVQGPS